MAEATRQAEEQALKEKMARAYRVYQGNVRKVDQLVYEITRGARGDVPEEELLERTVEALDRCDYGETEADPA